MRGMGKEESLSGSQQEAGMLLVELRDRSADLRRNQDRFNYLVVIFLEEGVDPLGECLLLDVLSLIFELLDPLHLEIHLDRPALAVLKRKPDFLAG